MGPINQLITGGHHPVAIVFFSQRDLVEFNPEKLWNKSITMGQHMINRWFAEITHTYYIIIIYIHITGTNHIFFLGILKAWTRFPSSRDPAGSAVSQAENTGDFCFVVPQKKWFKLILIWENNGIQFYMFKNHLKYKLRMWFYTFLLLLLSSFELQWDNNGILTWIDPPRGVIKRGELVDFPATKRSQLEGFSIPFAQWILRWKPGLVLDLIIFGSLKKEGYWI